MTWYLKSKVGAGSLALTDGSSLASAWNEWYQGQELYVSVYTFNSRGKEGTLRASATLNTLSDPMDFSVTFGSDVAVPDGGSVRVLLDDEYGQAPRWWQTSALTDHSIKAGTWTVRFDRSPPAVALLVGGGVSFIDGGFLVDDTVAIPAAPSDVTATFDTDHVDVAFTDNSATESGIKWKAAYDGGAYGSVTTVATPDTTSFTFTPTPGATSVKVAVASYNDDGDSAYVESNTVSLGGCPVWLLRHHSNLDLAWRH